MPALLDLRRSAAAFVAMTMNATFTASAFIVSDSVRARVTESARADVGNTDVVALADRKDGVAGGRTSERAAWQVSAADGVVSVRPYVEGGVLAGHQGAAREGSLLALDVPALTDNTRPVEGRLPQADSETAVPPAVLERQQDVEVGSALTAKASEDASFTTVNVANMVWPGIDVTRYDVEDISYVLAMGQVRTAMELPDGPAVLYVTGRAGTSDRELLSSIAEALATAQPEMQAYTASEIVTMRAKSSDGVASRVITFLQVIAPVCVVVSGVVIATAFTTLMARQTHQVGLLRYVNATRCRIVSSVLRAALFTRLARFIARAVVGAAIAIPIIGSGPIGEVKSRHLTIPWIFFTLAVPVGTVVTMVSVLGPARQTSQVPALVVLIGQAAGHESLGRRRVTTTVVRAVVVTFGLDLIRSGVTWQVLEMIGTGTVIIVLGIILALPLSVVGAPRLVGLVYGQERKSTLHLATRNLARNPGRAVAATASLFVAVTVVAAMSDGLSSVVSSMQTYVGYHTPVDITVGELNAGQDPSSITARITAVNGMEGVIPMPWPEITMTDGRQKDRKEVLIVSAVDAEMAFPALCSREALEALDDRVLLLDRTYNIADGTSVIFTGPAGSIDLTARVEERLDAAVTPIVTGQLVGNAPTASLLWVRVDGDGSDRILVSIVCKTAAGSGLSVSDSQEGRTNLTDQVRQVSIAISAILVFTLLITLLGLANTIDINVLERTREIGALHTAGTQHSEIRRLPIVEAILTMLLDGTIDTLLGRGVGIAGAVALPIIDSTDFLTVPVPWLALILVSILLISATVGVLVLLRPAENAGQIPPVHTFTQD